MFSVTIEELKATAANKLENPKTNAVFKGKVVESRGKRAGKVAFLGASDDVTVRVKILAEEASGLTMETSELLQVEGPTDLKIMIPEYGPRRTSILAHSKTDFYPTYLKITHKIPQQHSR